MMIFNYKFDQFRTSTLQITFIAITVLLISNITMAADLVDTDIIQFAPQTPVTANDFNTNFTVVKDAINTKQDKITQNCTSGSYVRQINADGTVVCETDRVSSGGGGGIVGVVAITPTGVSSSTDVSGVVTIQLDNTMLDNNAVDAVKAADGSGSNLDADLLDGRNSSDFVASNQNCLSDEAVSGVDASGNVVCTTNITNLNAGAGLSGGGISGALTVSVDPTTTQSRITGTCASGSAIRVINQDGSVSCEIDDDNGISDVIAGTHISKMGPVASPTLSVTGMPGVAFIQNRPAVGVGRTMSNVATLSVTPPQAGFVIVTVSGTGSACGDDYDGFGPTNLELQNATTTTTSPVFPTSNGTFAVGTLTYMYSFSYVFSVNAGNTTINLRARCQPPAFSNNGDISVHSFNALYVPNNITGP